MEVTGHELNKFKTDAFCQPQCGLKYQDCPVQPSCILSKLDIWNYKTVKIGDLLDLEAFIDTKEEKGKEEDDGANMERSDSGSGIGESDASSYYRAAQKRMYRSSSGTRFL